MNEKTPEHFINVVYGNKLPYKFLTRDLTDVSPIDSDIAGLYRLYFNIFSFVKRVNILKYTNKMLDDIDENKFEGGKQLTLPKSPYAVDDDNILILNFDSANDFNEWRENLIESNKKIIEDPNNGLLKIINESLDSYTDSHASFVTTYPANERPAVYFVPVEVGSNIHTVFENGNDLIPGTHSIRGDRPILIRSAELGSLSEEELEKKAGLITYAEAVAINTRSACEQGVFHADSETCMPFQPISERGGSTA